MTDCPGCGRRLADDDRFCPGCGRSAGEAGTSCASCGRPLGPDARFCGSCGHIVAADPPAPDAAEDTRQPAPAAAGDTYPPAPAAADDTYASTAPDTYAPTADDTYAPTGPPERAAPAPPVRPRMRLSPVAAAGALAVQAGALLPWLTVLDLRDTAWGLSVNGLLLGRGFNTGLAAGALLLPSLAVLVPAVAARRGVVFVLGAVDVLLVGFALLQAATRPLVGVGAGPFVTLAGGLLLAWAGRPAAPEPAPAQSAVFPPAGFEPTDDVEYVRPLPRDGDDTPLQPSPGAPARRDGGWSIPGAGSRRCGACGEPAGGRFCSNCGAALT